MLFLLVMEVLNGLLHKADEWHFLRTFGVCPIAHCALLYADDMVIFISQEAQDLAMLCLKGAPTSAVTWSSVAWSLSVALRIRLLTQ
jgi:hypothetical protein